MKNSQICGWNCLKKEVLQRSKRFHHCDCLKNVNQILPKITLPPQLFVPLSGFCFGDVTPFNSRRCSFNNCVVLLVYTSVYQISNPHDLKSLISSNQYKDSKCNATSESWHNHDFDFSHWRKKEKAEKWLEIFKPIVTLKIQSSECQMFPYNEWAILTITIITFLV